MFRKGDRVKLVKALASDVKYGLKEGGIYFVQRVVDDPICPYVVGITPETPIDQPRGWHYMAPDQIVLCIPEKAQVVHSTLIRDSQGEYWSLNKGHLFVIGSEQEVPEDENGYQDVKSIRAAWKLLIEEGYINDPA